MCPLGATARVYLKEDPAEQGTALQQPVKTPNPAAGGKAKNHVLWAWGGHEHCLGG